MKRWHERFMSVVQSIKHVLIAAIIGFTCYASFYVTVYLPVSVAHGEITTINVIQSWAAGVNASVWVSWGATAASLWYSKHLRDTQKKERERRDARIAELEKLKDPNRTSSGLDQEGEPRSKAVEP